MCYMWQQGWQQQQVRIFVRVCAEFFPDLCGQMSGFVGQQLTIYSLTLHPLYNIIRCIDVATLRPIFRKSEKYVQQHVCMRAI